MREDAIALLEAVYVGVVCLVIVFVGGIIIIMVTKPQVPNSLPQRAYKLCDVSTKICEQVTLTKEP